MKNGLNTMEKICKVWFDSRRVYIETDAAKVYSRPLEAFPVLLEATEEERRGEKICRSGGDMHWQSLDEDIHISSFLEETAEPDCTNDIAMIFARFPQLNVSEVARSIGINKSLLSKYIYGIKKPSEKRKQEIVSSLHSLGRELMAI